MPRYRRLPLILPLAVSLLAPVPGRAALIQTFDLTTLCFLSTDVVEARLTRHHIPGQEEWKDTFTATVLNPLEGRFHVGDQIKALDLELYDPARTGQHCFLFLAPSEWLQGKPLRAVDMLIIDSQSHVRRYFQQENPGGLVAESFDYTEHPPLPSQIKKTHSHGVLVYSYQANITFEENDAAEQKFRTLAEERLLIISKWAAAKKLKTPPYQVLHQTERCQTHWDR